MNDYFGGDMDRYKKHIKTFNKQCLVKHEIINELLPMKENVKKLQNMAHEIKGEAGYLGFDHLHKTCDVVNKRVHEKNFNEMRSMLSSALDIELKNIVAILKV